MWQLDSLAKALELIPIAAAVPHLQRKRHVDDLVPSLRGFRRRIRELREKASHATLEHDPPTEQALFTETLITRSSNPRVSFRKADYKGPKN